MAYSHNNQELETLIDAAMKKIGSQKEKDICRYLPGESGGYIHHFTLRKLRSANPEKLKDLINKFIIQPQKPVSVPPKQRASRGSRKQGNQVNFTKVDIERMLSMARQAGDSEMIRKLTPKKDHRSIKKELIVSIRHGRVEHDLWENYAESVGHALTAAHTATAGSLN